jgi:hypothetical protein
MRFTQPIAPTNQNHQNQTRPIAMSPQASQHKCQSWAATIFSCGLGCGLAWTNMIAPSVAAPNWQYVGVVNEYKYYLDTNSLATRENNRLLWLHVIFPRIQPNGGTAATHYISVNCQKRTMNIYQSILYNSDNQEISKREQGSEGTTVTVNGNPPGWELICK